MMAASGGRQSRPMPHRQEDSAPVHRSAAEQARFVAALTDMFEQRIRFNEVLGLRVQSLEIGRAHV